MKFIKDYCTGLVAVIFLGIEMALNLPDIKNCVSFTPLDYILWACFFVFLLIQMFKPQRDLNEYRSQKGKLEFSSNPYHKQITINDVRKNQKWGQISSSTGTLASMMMEIDDEEIEPTTNEYTFLLIDIKNNPRINTENRIAKHVSAKITLFDNKHRPSKQDGRWAFSKESDWYIGQKHRETLALDLYCYKEWSLIIAFKNQRGDLYYLNESSYRSNTLLNQNNLLQKDIYDIHLKVLSDNADEINQWYRFDTQTFEANPTEEPDWHKKIHDC